MKIQKLFLILIIILFPVSFINAALYRDLKVGDVGQDVYDLQKFLNKYDDTKISLSGPGSPGNETNYFGELTKQAIVNFQQKWREEVLVPVGLFYGTGYVGSSTRKHINFLLENPNYIEEQPLIIEIPTVSTQTTNTQSTILKIDSITPNSGTDGMVITITGSGFADRNDILVDLDSRYKYLNIKSKENGTKVEFTLDTEMGRVFEEEKKKLTNQQIDKLKSVFPPVEIGIRVENEYGRSNPATFTYLLD